MTILSRRLFLTIGGAAVSVCATAPALFAAGPGPLQGQLFGSGRDVLFVAMHGDLSNGANADYHHDIARRIAQSHSNVTAFGLIRPGYKDSFGNVSPGSNNKRRDHYTSTNNKLVADTIKNLKSSVGARRVVALGHSGGAAQLGTIIGRFPGLVDSAILVSCPCDIKRWRQINGNRAWTKSQSPSRFVNKVPAGTRLIAVTDSRDSNTRPVLASTYVDRLRKNGVPSAYIEVSGAEHNYGGALRRTAEQYVSQEIRR